MKLRYLRNIITCMNLFAISEDRNRNAKANWCATYNVPHLARISCICNTLCQRQTGIVTVSIVLEIRVKTSVCIRNEKPLQKFDAVPINISICDVP